MQPKLLIMQTYNWVTHGVFMSGAAFKGQIPVFMSLSFSQMEVAASHPHYLLNEACVYKIPIISC